MRSAHLSIYDPKVSKQQVISDLKGYNNPTAKNDYEKGTFEISTSVEMASENSDA